MYNFNFCNCTHKVDPPDVGFRELLRGGALQDGCDAFLRDRREEVVQSTSTSCMPVWRLCEGYEDIFDVYPGLRSVFVERHEYRIVSEEEKMK